MWEFYFVLYEQTKTKEAEAENNVYVLPSTQKLQLLVRASGFLDDSFLHIIQCICIKQNSDITASAYIL